VRIESEAETTEGGVQDDFRQAGRKSEILSFAHARNDLRGRFGGHLGDPLIHHVAEDRERPP
jgi:hypothetical protein